MNTLQGIDIYGGRLDTVKIHNDGLAKMVSIRGGLNNVEFLGLAAMISL